MIIDRVSASQIVAEMVKKGLISFPKPRHYKTPEERSAYKLKRRALQNECMRRLRAQRKSCHVEQWLELIFRREHVKEPG